MGKLNNDWLHGFQGSFETDEEVIEFIFDRINTNDFEDSYINVGGYSGEPNESMKYTAEEKRETVYDYLDYLVERKDRLEKALQEYENTGLTPKEIIKLHESCKIDIGQTVYVITQYGSGDHEIIAAIINRKTVKTRKTFSVSGKYKNGNFYNGTFGDRDRKSVV